MKLNGAIYAVACFAGLALCGCGVTKHLPENSYMLTGNRIEADRNAQRDERIRAGEFSRHIRQSPTKQLLWTNFPAWIYLQADPDKDNGWNNLLRRAGSEPVILDSALTELSAQALVLYMNSRGFYEASSDFSIRYNDRSRQARVTYSAEQGEPYRIGKIDYYFNDLPLEQIVRENSASSLLKPGDILDTEMLRNERSRISGYLRNRGYYRFSPSNISMVADTLSGNHTADLTIIVKQHVAGFDDSGNPIVENNSVYRIKEVFVNPNYEASLDVEESLRTSLTDTTYYQGLYILNTGPAKPKIRPAALRRAISLHPNYLYDYSQVQRTYNDLIQLGYFKTPNIIFEEIPDSGTGEVVTYVGGRNTGDTTVHTTERLLRCHILCSPMTRQMYTINFEATTTSSFYGLKSSLNYTNRNLFRGAEQFNAGIYGGYEFYRSETGRRNAYEIGFFSSISFPMFILPFPIDKSSSIFNPQTRVGFTFNIQDRPNYFRAIFGSNFSYSWNKGRYHSFAVRPVDLNIVDVRYIREEFLEYIRGTYLESSYKSQIIPATSASYQYRDPVRTVNGNRMTFRINAEIAGNLLYGFSSLFSEKVETPLFPGTSINETETAYVLFGVPFAQYFRIDASFSNLMLTSENTAIAYRIMGGIGLNYGNSSSMPVDKQFYAGGGNSMRGWAAKTLGPGNTPRSEQASFASQTGNMRLEANIEFRFPIAGSLKGACFCDAGNVWNVNIRGNDQDMSVFNFNSLLSQTGFNTGFGLRFDVGLTVIRLDWGIILHDPGNPAGQRWINGFRFSNTALNFGIDYPF